MGSPIYKGHRPNADAAVVALLRAAGAVILGKTVTAEFAGVAPSETLNPHNPAHTPGGSSSGSGAAVADWMVPIALGTQTGGSVQRPASYCGAFGFKPTFGRINRAGMKFAAESLDTIGWIARSVDDLALVDAVLSGAQWAPLAAQAPTRVGLCRTYLWDKALPETRDAVEGAAQRLVSAGIVVKPVDLPAEFVGLSELRGVINDYERSRALAHEWATHRESISPQLSRTISRGYEIPHARYIEAMRSVERMRVRFDEIAGAYDALIAPCVNGEAPEGIAYAGDPSFQSLWTLLHVPTVGLPTHRGPKGLPVSIQVIGARYADARLLQVGSGIWNAVAHAARAH
jgi:Asp-tRNA(Asn)/Glu-tRNA(Gln) amidotransferase A subunit family amidase